LGVSAAASEPAHESRNKPLETGARSGKERKRTNRRDQAREDRSALNLAGSGINARKPTNAPKPLILTTQKFRAAEL